ncbi:MAG: electron transfer flavoprotein subunit alpha/FixB family protein, partial [Trueperaceae bacterium]|nr:electron transfer flavoprotein subunit alpha/FixB family protein [Trueperaceae bacterium]
AHPVVVTTKVGGFAPAEPAATPGGVEDLAVPGDPADAGVTVERTDGEAGDRAALEEAPVVVTGGRGLGGPEAFDAFVVPLADALQGAVGATRAAVDAGWRPYAEQIGQTGKTVAPDVYLSLGVSGAVQHLSGMNRSRTVVAIDHDPDAPIFAHCDVGVVADAHAFAPLLLAALAGD